MNPFPELIDWLKESPDLAPLEFWPGVWRDTTANAGSRLCALMSVGGRGMTDVDYGTIRILLLSPQKGTTIAGEKTAMAEIAYNLRQRLKTDYRTCNIGQIRLIGGIIGPGQTENDRIWFQLQFELISF